MKRRSSTGASTRSRPSTRETEVRLIPLNEAAEAAVHNFSFYCDDCRRFVLSMYGHEDHHLAPAPQQGPPGSSRLDDLLILFLEKEKENIPPVVYHYCRELGVFSMIESSASVSEEIRARWRDFLLEDARSLVREWVPRLNSGAAWLGGKKPDAYFMLEEADASLLQN